LSTRTAAGGRAASLTIANVSSSRRREPSLEGLAAAAAIDLVDPGSRRDGLAERVDDEPGRAVVDHFRHRAAAEGHHRRAARQRLDHHQPEGLGPVDGKEEGAGVPEERRLPRLVDLADELDERMGEQAADVALEVVAIGGVDLGGDLQRPAARRGDGDGAVDALLW
jgi:hypothetical protein